MTEQEIDAMEAGREMDALIHKRVFGYESLPCVDPPYSTDLDAAWLVVEKLRELGFWCRMDTPWINGGSPADKFWAGFTPHQTTGWNGGPDYWEEGDTLPLAICRAALWAVMNCHKITTNEADEPTEKTG